MKSFARVLVIALSILFAVTTFYPQTTNEILLSDTENAYNPIPSPDGKLIAFVRTGWGRMRGSGGFGRSNLRSEIAVMTDSGEVLTHSSIADAFLFGWTREGGDLVCYRDAQFLLVGPYGGKSREARETDADFMFSERVAYLTKTDTFVWVEHQHAPGSQILTEKEQIAEIGSMTGNLVIPSPDERYIALAGNGTDLWVFDTATKKWANLGRANIHPYSDWDYIKPSWNPWFPDSSRLAFFSASRLMVASPDGRLRKVVADIKTSAGLAAVSPDGKQIAYATFVARPMNRRPDLSFWGGSSLWIVSAEGKGKPRRITSPNEDTTYDLHWLGNDRLVFDRVSDTGSYSHARLWVASVFSTRP